MEFSQSCFADQLTQYHGPVRLSFKAVPGAGVVCMNETEGSKDNQRSWSSLFGVSFTDRLSAMVLTTLRYLIVLEGTSYL